MKYKVLKGWHCVEGRRKDGGSRLAGKGEVVESTVDLAAKYPHRFEKAADEAKVVNTLSDKKKKPSAPVEGEETETEEKEPVPSSSSEEKPRKKTKS